MQLTKSWQGLSSQILSTSYNEEKKEMTVAFVSSGTYRYSDVSKEMWEKSLKAASIGKFMNTDIKPNCTVKKLG